MNLEPFAIHGFALIPGILPAAECATIASRIQPNAASAGTRCLLPQAWCAALARRLRQHPVLSSLVPVDHVAVQCTYFEKSAARNWLVPIHQDLSIPVARRVDAPGLRGWSEKEGALFVQVPAELLAKLVAVRVHLDACGADDGPVRVLPGSHRLGLVAPRGGDPDAQRRRRSELRGQAGRRAGDAALAAARVLQGHGAQPPARAAFSVRSACSAARPGVAAGAVMRRLPPVLIGF